MEISQDKIIALKKITEWFSNHASKQYITLGGYAGTGKTTLIAFYREQLYKTNPKLNIAFASYTGKAARVLSDTLKAKKALYPKDFAGTIHSLIYSPIVNKNEEIVGWEPKDELKYDLIIVDEASMIDEQIWHDLLSYKLPILAVGDHGQLPPINGKFNLMAKPEIILSEIHRQTIDNPVIALSVLAREKGEIPIGKFGAQVQKLSRYENDSQEIMNDLLEQFDENTLVICGYNSTRIKLNQYIRQLLGYENPNPVKGDRVICLRNNHKKKIFNGMLGTINLIESSDENWYHVEIALDNEKKEYKGLIYKDQFNSSEPINFTKNRKLAHLGDLFDFGYALTVHKAQGSEAPKVILFEEKFKQMSDEMWRRWLYTAVTRSSGELYIFG